MNKASPTPDVALESPPRPLAECGAEHAVVVLDAEGRVAAWNAGAEHAFGLRPEEMSGLPAGGSRRWLDGHLSSLHNVRGDLWGYAWVGRESGREAEANDAPRRVLVVEDNCDAADSLALLLRMWGHDVRVAHDGLRAIEIARDFIPEVVLLDIGLPAVSGYEVAVWLRGMPVLGRALLVAVTAYGQEEDRRRSRQAGFDAHLVKPAAPAALHALLKQKPNRQVGDRRPSPDAPQVLVDADARH